MTETSGADAEDDGGARRARLADGERDEQLPDSRLEQTGERERPGRTRRARRAHGASSAAATSATASAPTTVASVAAAAAGWRASPIRSPTLMPPKSSAEQRASPTAVTGGRYSSACGASSAAGSRSARRGPREKSGMKTCASGPIETA